MRKSVILSLIIFLPTICQAVSDDPCYPDQMPVDRPEACHDITELSWGGVTPAETIDPGTTGQVTVLNGLPPFTFELEGSGFTLDASALPESRTREIYADTCGAATITVTDSCGKSVKGQVYTSNGQWINVGTLAECPWKAPFDDWDNPRLYVSFRQACLFQPSEV